jgi:hypothetical protein
MDQALPFYLALINFRLVCYHDVKLPHRLPTPTHPGAVPLAAAKNQLSALVARLE